MSRRGLTLVELLIAIILTGIVAFIVIEMLGGEQANYTVTRRKIRLQGDAREAMRILEEEIKNTGFRTVVNASSPASMTEMCAGSGGYSAGVYFDPQPASTNPSIYGSHASGLEIRFYNPMGTLNYDCTTDLWTIGYRYDSTTKMLHRQAVHGSTALAADGFVPFLDSVLAFEAAYGTYQEDAALLTTLQAKAASWRLSSGIGKTHSGDTAVTLTYPGTSGTYDAIVDWSLGVLDSMATYRISFTTNASDSLLSSAKGIGPAGEGYVQIGMFDPSWHMTKDTFTVRPLVNSVNRSVQYDLAPLSRAASAARLGVRVVLKGSDASNTRSLTISNLKVERLNSGRYLDWLAAEEAVADAAKVKAIRLRITMNNRKRSAKGSGSTSDSISLERIIPVVNNGD